jgi:hypothetical protein
MGKTYDMPAGPEMYPGTRDYWASVTDVPCPACDGGTVRHAEANYVPGWRRCDGCGREFMAGGTDQSPTLEERQDPRRRTR